MSDTNSGDLEIEIQDQETAGATSNETPSEDEGNSQPGEMVEESKEEQRLHLQALNLIGSVLDTRDSEFAKEYFANNPDLAEKANRSKRHKEAYRALMESEDEPQEREYKSSPAPEVDVVEQAALRVYQMNLKADRQLQTEKFAQAEGLNIDQVDDLNSSAQALYDANKGNISFARCLIAAKTAYETEAKATQKVPTSQNLTTGSSAQKEFDGSPGEWVTAQ